MAISLIGAKKKQPFSHCIGASNVVEPQQSLKPDLHLLPNTSFFERNDIFMPEHLVVENGQRPFPTS